MNHIPASLSQTRQSLGRPANTCSLTSHPLAPLSSHPFTIASLPEDGKMEFVVLAKKGATKRFFKYAEKVYPRLPSSSSQNVGRGVLIDGPYGRVRPLRQFDSLVFFAGSTGATFTMPLMRDIVRQWLDVKSASAGTFSPGPAVGAVTRHIRFVWVVKQKAAISWFGSQLNKVVADVDALRNDGCDIAIHITIYVTCDEMMTSSQSSMMGNNPESDERVEYLAENKTAEKLIGKSSRSATSKGFCCTHIVTDENVVDVPCECRSTNQQASSMSSFSLDKSSLVNSRISLLFGRPHLSIIIRKTAELGLGEMAVVVCGPPGLVQSTRNAVVAISDERAVHKGTGAQGIYVHAETFGYA